MLLSYKMVFGIPRQELLPMAEHIAIDGAEHYAEHYAESWAEHEVSNIVSNVIGNWF